MDRLHHLTVFRSLFMSIGQSFSEVATQLRVSNIRRQNEGLSLPLEISIFIWHNNSVNTIFTCGHTRTYRGQFEAKYSHRVELRYNAPFFGAPTSNIAHFKDSCDVIRNASLSTCCCYIQSAKLLLKINSLYTFIKQQDKETNGRNDAYDSGMVHLDQVALSAAPRKEANLLIRPRKTLINNNQSVLSSFHT